jgi:TPR repeat protein
MKIRLLMVVGALVLPQLAWAAYSDGLAAYQAHDYRGAFDAWQQAAAQGDSAAQASLAIMYYRGDGVPQDDTQAAYWMRKAADQGGAAAQVFLGSMYFDGRGVPKDDMQAVIWFRKAAGQDDARAQDLLGTMYYRGGVGVQRDPAIAAAWFKQAAQSGYAASQYNLAVCYDDGAGVEHDPAQALTWLRRAAAQAYAPALLALAQRYQAGQGGAGKNPALAYLYLEVALRYATDPDASNTTAIAGRIAQLHATLEAQLNQTELRLAHERAVNWSLGQPLP